MEKAKNIEIVVDIRLNNDEKEIKYTISREDARATDNLDMLHHEHKNL